MERPDSSSLFVDPALLPELRERALSGSSGQGHDDDDLSSAERGKVMPFLKTVSIVAGFLMAASKILLPDSAAPVQKAYIARVQNQIHQSTQVPALVTSGANYLLVDGHVLDCSAHEGQGGAGSPPSDPLAQLDRAVEECVVSSKHIPSLSLRHIENGQMTDHVLGRPNPFSEQMVATAAGVSDIFWHRFMEFKLFDGKSWQDLKRGSSATGLANRSSAYSLLAKQP